MEVSQADNSSSVDIEKEQVNINVGEESDATSPSTMSLSMSNLAEVMKTLEIDDGTKDGFEEESRGCFKVHFFLVDYHDCFFNWVSPDKPLTTEEAEIMGAILSNKFENINPTMASQQLCLAPVEIIAQRLCLSFCNLVLGKIPQAQEELKRVTATIMEAAQKTLISIDYVEGLVYLFTGLEAFKQSLLLESSSEKGKMEEELNNFLKGSTSLQILPKMARVVITGVHSFFAGNRRNSVEEIELLECALVADPKNIEWYSNLHGVQRIHRKSKDYRAGPNEDEKMTILRALKVNKDHVMMKLHVCMYLCDMIRTRKWDPSNGSLMLDADWEFYSIQEAVDHMKEKCNEIVNEGQPWVKINLNIAEIFGFSLPVKYRDTGLAMTCLNKALEMNPKSSKANHKMSLLLLCNGSPPEDALKYVKDAFDYDHRNFPALLDTIQIMLSKPDENSQELETIFETHLVKDWEESRRTSLRFLKGIYDFMMGKREEALWGWIGAYKTDPKCLKDLKKISYLCSRYSWDPNRISINEVSKFMKQIHTHGGNMLIEVPSSNDLRIISTFVDFIGSDNPGQEIRGRGSGRGTRGSYMHSQPQHATLPHSQRGHQYQPLNPTATTSGANSQRGGHSSRWINQKKNYQQSISSISVNSLFASIGNESEQSSLQSVGKFQREHSSQQPNIEGDNPLVPLSNAGRGMQRGKGDRGRGGGDRGRGGGDRGRGAGDRGRGGGDRGRGGADRGRGGADRGRGGADRGRGGGDRGHGRGNRGRGNGRAQADSSDQAVLQSPQT